MNRKVTICITGATDGIGKELAIQYEKNGYLGQEVQLVLIGRKTLSELDRAFYNEANYCQADLTQDTASEKILRWFKGQAIGGLDLLIHNAGAGYVGRLDEQPFESIDTLVAVNIHAPIALTHALLSFLGQSVSERISKVVFVSSVASSLPTPDYAVYSATKAAIDGLARNLRTEFNAPQSPHKIEVQLILPGATKTNMHSKSGADLEALKWENFPSVDSVAEKIRSAIDSGRFINPIGWKNGIFRSLGRYAGPLVDGLTQRQFQKQHPASPQSLPALKDGQSTPHAVITGAADGIGKALAKRLLAKGYSVTGVDFDKERAAQTLSELDASGQRMTFVFGNLGDLAEVERISSELARGEVIDLMIHNAGISAVGHFAEVELERQQLVVDVNFRAPLLLAASALSKNLMRAGGSFIFMSSLSYYAGYPGASVYGASKDGLASFARSLGSALAGSKINVLTVFPGPTRTAHARRYSPDNSREEKRMSPDELAGRIIDAMEKRRKKLVPGGVNQLSAAIGKYFPRLMDFAMRKVILDKLSTPEENG